MNSSSIPKEIRKNFVPYNIAIRLKKLGFGKACIAYFKEDKILVLDNIPYFNQNKDICSAPTWTQVLRWLENKGFYIYIRPEFYEDGINWNYSVLWYKPKKDWLEDEEHEISGEGWSAENFELALKIKNDSLGFEVGALIKPNRAFHLISDTITEIGEIKIILEKPDDNKPFQNYWNSLGRPFSVAIDIYGNDYVLDECELYRTALKFADKKVEINDEFVKYEGRDFKFQELLSIYEKYNLNSVSLQGYKVVVNYHSSLIKDKSGNITSGNISSEYLKPTSIKIGCTEGSWEDFEKIIEKIKKRRINNDCRSR